MATSHRHSQSYACSERRRDVLVSHGFHISLICSSFCIQAAFVELRPWDTHQLHRVGPCAPVNYVYICCWVCFIFFIFLLLCVNSQIHLHHLCVHCANLSLFRRNCIWFWIRFYFVALPFLIKMIFIQNALATFMVQMHVSWKQPFTGIEKVSSSQWRIEAAQHHQ